MVPLGVKELEKNLEGTVKIFYDIETSKILGAPGVIKFKKIKTLTWNFTQETEYSSDTNLWIK